MKPIKNLLFFLLFFVSSPFSFGQAPQTSPSRDQVLEVTYYKGRPFAYQRVGEWTWYELFPRASDWKPRAGELPVAAVKLYVRDEAGTVHVKVTVLRGPAWPVCRLTIEPGRSPAATLVATASAPGAA